MRYLRNRTRYVCLIAALYALPGATQPQSEVKDQPSLQNQIEGTRAVIETQQKQLFTDPLAGIVINRTVTVQGNDFYRFLPLHGGQRAWIPITPLLFMNAPLPGGEARSGWSTADRKCFTPSCRRPARKPGQSVNTPST